MVDNLRAIHHPTDNLNKKNNSRKFNQMIIFDTLSEKLICESRVVLPPKFPKQNTGHED